MRINPATEYIERRHGGETTRKNIKYNDVFIVKSANHGGVLTLTQIYFPKEFIGKRVRFKAEILP